MAEGPDRASARRRNAILVPPIPWLGDRDSYLAGVDPDPFRLERDLKILGLTTSIVDPYPWPLNPFAGMTPLFQSLDPLRALRLLARNRRADFVISVFEGAAVPLLLLRWVFFFRPKIVLWDIGLTETWRARMWILNFVVPRCDGIMVLNSSQVDYIRRKWSPTCRVEVIGHGVDIDFFRPATFVEHGPILSVGDDIGRDFATLVAAMTGSTEKLLVKTRQPVPMADNVSVIRERISYAELRDLYARCVFVIVPLHATLNANGVSTILEAAAMGKAIIVSDSSAISDFIIPNETCLVVPRNEPAALRQTIERLLGDAPLRRRLGENARRFAENRCSGPAFASRFAAALRQFDAEPKAPSL